jgi:hypothetical protein
MAPRPIATTGGKVCGADSHSNINNNNDASYHRRH